LVQQARARGHPLHVAAADAAAVAGGILVVDFAVEHHGHGLEAAVRMPADAARLLRRRKVRRARVVEQQEGRELGMTPVVEHCMHGKTVANPVPFGLAVDAQDVFHAPNMSPYSSDIKGSQSNRSSRYLE